MYQSGGYYIPEWTKVPASFNLAITEIYVNGSEEKVSMGCVGY